MHPKCMWPRTDVVSSISTFFIKFFHMATIFCCFSAILMSSAYTDRDKSCFRWTNIHSQFGKNFVQEVSQNLQFTTWFWFSNYVVEDVSKHLEIPNWEFWAIWEHPSTLPKCWQILHHLLDHPALVILQQRPWLLRQSSGTQTSPISVKNCWSSRVVFYNVQAEHESAFVLRKFLVLTPHFLKRHMSINVAKKTCFVSLCFQNNLLFALDFVQLPSWNRLDLLPFLFHCSFCIRNLHRLWHRG